ncbi:MAG TPA: porin family protein [Thiothrix sp.]|nr:porin family protein [Thiothrix sp.]
MIMKKTYLAVTLCTLMVTTSTYARSGGYAGISFGQMVGDADVVEFKDTTFKLFAGHQVNDLIAVEGHYAKMDDTQSGVNLEISTLGVSAVITPIKNNKFRPFAKVGWNRLSTDSSTHIVADDSDSGVTFGAGLQVALAKNFSIRGEYDRFDSDVDMLSIGAAFEF